jgi:ATP-binding cassette subfamily E protein 1
MIRSLVADDNYVIAIEHDLSILDYLSDSICVIYGIPGQYGIVSIPFPVAEGINHFLSGIVPDDGKRFRES